MRAWTFIWTLLFSVTPRILASPYKEDIADWNINTNQHANSPLEYSTPRRAQYTPSPANWRSIPFYTVLLDKFADGDPTNNDFFKTMYEWDWRETQLRFGGDLKGLTSKLDYVQGMGFKGIFISGTPFLNMPWQADSYSPLDFSVLDPHWGTLKDWQDAIDEIHRRGMYIMADFTIGTMSDLIGFSGFTNQSTPFDLREYDAVWKDSPLAPWGFNEYKDFKLDNGYNASCILPVFWADNGTQEHVPWTTGCKKSEFDQYGDMEAFGVHPDWQRQLSKFASVQDRLREWKPEVLAKLKNFACMTITALDLDAIRIDKATQVTVDAISEWAASTRACAADIGKKNFFISGEVTGGDNFGAIYYGRGRTPTQRPLGFLEAANTTAEMSQYFLRDPPLHGIDAVAFHYSIYRSLSRFLGMDGNLQVAFDVDGNFVTAWNQMFVNDDLLNAATGEVDPRHMYGTSNFDVFRWPSLDYGAQRSVLGSFITTLVMPGIPLYFYGEEQNFYLYDSSAANYLYGRQSMVSNTAWQTHGCYKLGSEQYFNMPLGRAFLGCHDDWNSLDHFDPTSESRRIFGQMNFLRTQFSSLQDGFNLVQRGNWTYMITRPGSNGTRTEMGLWSVSRAPIPGIQKLSGNSDQVWLLYTNENATRKWGYDCLSDLWISSPYQGGDTVRNLFFPYEKYTLKDSGSSYFNDSKAPYYGCLESVTMLPYGFKALVPDVQWVPPPIALTRFLPGHDARVQVEDGAMNATRVDISLEFNTPMNCDSVTQSMSFKMSAGSSPPTIQLDSVKCNTLVGDQPTTRIQGVSVSQWSWTATLQDFVDGILEIQIDKPAAQDGRSMNGTDHLLLRKGSAQNVMVFPRSDYDDSAFGYSDGHYTFKHKAMGADMYRYSANYGRNWSDWKAIEALSTLDNAAFADPGNFWDGQHVIVQYYSDIAKSASTVVHADRGFEKQRRVPQLLARGPFNQWGYDKGIPAKMSQRESGHWELEIMATWPTYLQLNVWGYDNYFYGDTDGDGVLDRLPPNSNAPNYVNISAPPRPHLAWALVVDDKTMTWMLEPRGESAVGAITFALLLTIPVITAALAVVIFMWTFYGIKYNEWGVKPIKAHSKYFPILGGKSKGSAHADMATPTTENVPGSGHKHVGEIIGWPEDASKRRTVLIATLEYEIIDWKMKVKIGGLGVMSSLMGKAMTDVDLIWVVPKVQDLEYPAGEPAEPIEVTIFGEPYLIEVETHVMDNITYVILDSPVFRAQTKADPYPARMDDLSSAIFYSTWNQAIAATVRRFPTIDIYHVNDYHGALVPIYLLPKVVPICLSLHNAEFQGLWPLRTKEEMKEVCSAFNISKEHCAKYVQFGNTFNLLHAAASFISVHQKSVGVAGVSDKYGKRSWARYPALWTLKHVDSLPNPDPTDIAALDENPISVRDIKVDQHAEAERPALKRQAQEWARIKQDPNADLFVFVGRWSKQKGVDLIADVMPSLLEKRPSIQLIAVGPVIDLYGRFAAEKLARLMELYPDRVYSKPEFTALPPYLFSGADFALIPSRDEPFGLVAVEFGRKGALGVGSRLGGLGLMPGWWFPVESASTEHMISQLTKTIKLALKSTEEERALLRARSAVQRFPVVEWRQRMEDFHRRSIITSRHQAGANAWRPSDAQMPAAQLVHDGSTDWDPVFKSYPSQPEWETRSASGTPGFPGSPGQWSMDTLTPGERIPTPPPLTRCRDSRDSASIDLPEPDGDYFSHNPHAPPDQDFGNFLERANRAIARDHRNAPDPFLEAPMRPPFGTHSRASSVESIASIMEEKQNSPLNHVMASFTDADGGVSADFVQKLKMLNAQNSRHELSIEKYLIKSEEAYFDKVRKDRLSSAMSIRSRRDSVYGGPPPSSFDHSRSSSPAHQSFHTHAPLTEYNGPLPNDNEPVVMTKLQIALSREVFGWPWYTVIIALGQMLAATSFQITLLSGQNFQTTLQLYVLGSIFLASSAIWYTLFRMKPSVYVLSIPWIFFGVAFFLIGIPSLSASVKPAHVALSNAATWSYAVASAAAFCFFGLNFGEEAGASTEVWMLRAVIVQGSQQIWVAALWYWGYALDGNSEANVAPWWIVFIVWPLSIMSFAFAYLMLYGLPEYYHQTPPKVPNFLKTLFRRKLVLWFLGSEILRDYWLSGPYGRNWSFLWNVPIAKWKILLLIITFFVIIWGLLMGLLTHLSKTHTWLLPVFAVGLGAPRWCQIMWGTSSLALYIPWAGHSGPYLGICLWLWLGVLDATQGVGLGLILLQTLSRLHVCATLAFAQFIGAICVMVARATAPNRIGPTSVFPEVGSWDFEEGLKGSPLASAPFWLALVCQLIIVIGYFWFYRKEQLSRP